MKLRNIFKDKSKIIQTHKDYRGIISDILQSKIQHAALIESKPNVIRGNHFHKNHTTYDYDTRFFRILVQKAWYKK